MQDLFDHAGVASMDDSMLKRLAIAHKEDRTQWTGRGPWKSVGKGDQVWSQENVGQQPSWVLFRCFCHGCLGVQWITPVPTGQPRVSRAVPKRCPCSTRQTHACRVRPRFVAVEDRRHVLYQMFWSPEAALTYVAHRYPATWDAWYFFGMIRF